VVVSEATAVILTALQWLLLATAAATAVALARRAPGHIPVAVYLVALLVLSLCRLGLGQLLPAGSGVREGCALLWRDLGQACYVAGVAALPMMGWAMWGRRTRR
jgi:hypothetical protein